MKFYSLTLLFLILFSGLPVKAQEMSTKELDREAIKSMCGCFEVDFKFVETFSDIPDYEFHDRYTAHAGAELAILVGEEEDKIQIQHILVVGSGMTVKHWRQDWVYKSDYEYHYDKDQNWTYVDNAENKPRTWTQKVYQVDDSPRYEGTASWVHQNGRTYWESSTYAPLPRREYTTRSDYNVMYRRNRQEVTTEGWIHEQDNTKVLRTDSTGDQALAHERGVNTYKRIADSNCQDAIDWWEENQEFWALVRKVWSSFYDEKRDLEVNLKHEGKSLIKSMYALNEQWLKDEARSKRKWRKKLKSHIELYVYHP